MPLPVVPGADQSRETYWGLSLTAWFQIVTIALLMCAMFRFNLARLWGKTNPINGQDSNWQHSIFVPLIGIYYLYIHRDELLKARVRLAWSGLPILLLGILIFLYGIYPGQNDYIKDFGMVVTIFGVVAFLAGWQVMKIAWFPIAFLVVALPWPELVYSKFAWPLQKLAASVAVGALRVCGIEANNFGTKIAIWGKVGTDPRILNVAEACAGLRSLMTFVMVAGTVAFLSSRPMWEKVVITLSAIPVAIFCNVVRVSGQGILDHVKGPEWSEGFAHQFVGLIMLIPGFFLILLVGWILDMLFIEEVDRDSLKLAGAGAGAGAGGGGGAAQRKIVEVPKKTLVTTQNAPPATATAAATTAQAPTPTATAAEAADRIAAAAQRIAPAATALNADTPTARDVSKPAAPPPASLKPAAPRAAPAKPPAAPQARTPVQPQPQTTQSSGLLPSPVKSKTQPPAAAMPLARTAQATPASTLKPSSKPPVTVQPPSAPAQSGLKPSAPKPRPTVQAPGLKPSASKPQSTQAPATTKTAPPAKTAPKPPQSNGSSQGSSQSESQSGGSH